MIILSQNQYILGSKSIIAEHFSRAANGGIELLKPQVIMLQFYPTSKCCRFSTGNWTDATHTKLEEAGTMNVFFRINDTLFTAPTSESLMVLPERVLLTWLKNITVAVRRF
jgi:branched-chain amino acid aminotransferase